MAKEGSQSGFSLDDFARFGDVLVTAQDLDDVLTEAGAGGTLEFSASDTMANRSAGSEAGAGGTLESSASDTMANRSAGSEAGAGGTLESSASDTMANRSAGSEAGAGGTLDDDSAKKKLMYSCTRVDRRKPDLPTDQILQVEENGTDLAKVNKFRRGQVIIDRDWLMCHEARKNNHRLVMYHEAPGDDLDQPTLELRLTDDSTVPTLGVFTCDGQSYAAGKKIGRFVGSLLDQGDLDIVDQHPLYEVYGMEAEVGGKRYHVVPGSNYAFGLMHFVNAADYDAGNVRTPNVTAYVEHGEDGKVSIIFKAKKAIGPKTELLVNYGSEYYGDRLTARDLKFTENCLYYGPDNKWDACDKVFYDFVGRNVDKRIREKAHNLGHVPYSGEKDNNWALLDLAPYDGEAPMRSPFFLEANADLNSVIESSPKDPVNGSRTKTVEAIIDNPSMNAILLCKFAAFVALVNHGQKKNYSPGLANVLYKVYMKALDKSSKRYPAQRCFVHYKLGLVLFSMALGMLPKKDERLAGGDPTMDEAETLTIKLREMAKRHFAQALPLANRSFQHKMVEQITRCEKYVSSKQLDDLRNPDAVSKYNENGITFRKTVMNQDSKRKTATPPLQQQGKAKATKMLSSLLQLDALRF